MNSTGHPDDPPTLTALGTMSGTSMDGIDVALIRTDGERVDELGWSATIAYDEALRGRIAAATAAPDTLDDAARNALAAAITDAHRDAITVLLGRHGLDPEAIDVIGFHGHTLVHAPERHRTVQLGDGDRLARTTGIDVVSDFRAADVRAGGQGAPFAPLFHAAMARELPQPLAIVNLGGVGNVTLVDGDGVLAFDTGPGNALIDDWVFQHGGKRYDEDGRLGLAGEVHQVVLDELLDHPFFKRPLPKSLDRNAFSLAPLRRHALELADGAATLAAFTARSVAGSRTLLPSTPKRWLISGGGRLNPALMEHLRTALEVPVEPVESVGWSGDAIEAQAFGFLAVRSLRELPLSLPTTTGVPCPMTGGVRYSAPVRA